MNELIIKFNPEQIQFLKNKIKKNKCELNFFCRILPNETLFPENYSFINGFFSVYYETIIINSKNPKQLLKQFLPENIISSGQILYDGPEHLTVCKMLSFDNKKNTNFLKNDGEIGADEVGVGDYFGPLVAVATYIKSDQYKYLDDLGVKDSKEISDSSIHKIANDLMQKTNYTYKIFSAKEYNNKINENFNSHHIKTILHNENFWNLLKNIKPNEPRPLINLDAYCSKENYIKYCNDLDIEPAPIDNFIQHSENKYRSIACASIIARHLFLNEIDLLTKSIGIKVPLGSTHVIDQAKLIYKKVGKKTFKNLVKWHFKTTKEVIN